MEHVVFFPAQDGSPAFRRVAGLEEAVRLVEDLRNVEGVTGTSVYALTEVPLAFKAYYRVEVPGAGAAPVVPAQGGDAAPAAPVAPLEEPSREEPSREAPSLETASREGAERGAPSLGFFA